jgi:hypothetical protein
LLSLPPSPRYSPEPALQAHFPPACYLSPASVVVQVPAQGLTGHRSAGDQWEPVLEQAEGEAPATDTDTVEVEVDLEREQVHR